MNTISRDDLKNMNESHQDFVLINVLDKVQFNKNHIRTSINIPVESDNFANLVEFVAGSHERKIVVYCANFDCTASLLAAEKLDKAGFTHVFDYSGETQDWIERREAA